MNLESLLYRPEPKGFANMNAYQGHCKQCSKLTLIVEYSFFLASRSSYQTKPASRQEGLVTMVKP